MLTPIDLDHNATTRPLPDVVDAVAAASRDAYANPGSRHAAGRAARRVLESARERMAAILDAQPDELVFTSGGTESNNLALFGLARGTGTVLTGPGEHPATAQAVAELALRGWRQHTLRVDAAGRLLPDQLPALPWSDIKLAVLLLAHNETGVVQDAAPLVACANAAGVPVHIDAVQAVGKLPVSFRTLGAATLSFGAHKFHGPRGIGGLLVRRGVRLVPRGFGGFQESGRRPGTEPVALIAGMATALELWHAEAARRTTQMTTARDHLEAGLCRTCAPVIIHGQAAPRLSNTSSIAFPGLDGETLLVALDLAGIACSTGSTCASGSAEPAPILLAMGVAPELAAATLRFSVGFQTTVEAVDDAVERIAGVVRRLRTVSGPSAQWP